MPAAPAAGGAAKLRRAESRARRLTGAGSFETVFRDGTRREGRYVQIVIAPAARSVGRAGFVVGRKALRRAIDRNRLKRLLREFLRAARSRIADIDLVIRLKHPIKPETVSQAAAEACALITQAVDARAGVANTPQPRP